MTTPQREEDLMDQVDKDQTVIDSDTEGDEEEVLQRIYGQADSDGYYSGEEQS